MGSRNDFGHREGWKGCLLPGLKVWKNSQAVWQILLHRCSGRVGKTHLSLLKPVCVEHSEQGLAWRAGCQRQRWMGPSCSRLKFLISLSACLRLPACLRLLVLQRFLNQEKKIHSTVLMITIILVLAEPKNVRLTTPLCLKEANPS